MASRPITVLLVEDNPGDARLMHEILKDVTAAEFDLTDAVHLRDALDLLSKQSFDIVLLDLRLPDSQGFDTFTRLHDRVPNVPVVVLTGLHDETIALRAVQEGAQDYLVKGQVDGEHLARSMRYAVARHTTQQTHQETARVKRGRILGFWGAKGGVGTTTVALNIGAALKVKGKNVIALELQSAYGTFACYLRGVPSANLSQLAVMEPERIGPRELSACLSGSEDSVRVLLGPQRVEEFAEISPEVACAIAEGLADMADFTIIDLGCHPSAAAAAAAGHCDFMVIVTVPEPTWLETVKMALEVVRSWHVPEERLGMIIVNRVGLFTSVNLHEVSSRLQCRIIGSVPSAADDMLSAQQIGQPLVVCEPDSKASVSLFELADRLAADRVIPMVQSSD